MFVTFEETSSHIRRNAASLGFPIEQWEDEGKWAFVDASTGIGEEAPTVGSYDLGALVARIQHAVRQTGARRVALDSLGAIFTRFTGVETIRHELVRIAAVLETLGVTSVLTAERPAEYDGVTRYGVEQFVLDNVIILRNVLRQGRRSRTVEIVKFRGAPHRSGEWLFTVDPRDGIVVVPLAFLVSSGRASPDRVSSGNAELDEMCGGGFYRDAIVLMSGPTGTGKTLAGLRFAASAFEAGERSLFCTFDETREQLFRNADGWGLDIRSMQASGLLRVIADYPEVASPEDHFLQLRRAIEEFGPVGWSSTRCPRSNASSRHGPARLRHRAGSGPPPERDHDASHRETHGTAHGNGHPDDRGDRRLHRCLGPAPVRRARRGDPACDRRTPDAGFRPRPRHSRGDDRRYRHAHW